MCTVVIRVPPDRSAPIRLLAIRDEDPARPWDPLGPWWPDSHPGVVGVRDRRAGGAWLAARSTEGRLAVLLNRAEPARAGVPLRSRGEIVLETVDRAFAESDPQTPGFNLVAIDREGARVHHWDGRVLRTTALAPGTHMVAHDDVDDARTARIGRWLSDFAEEEADDSATGSWRDRWMSILDRSATLAPTDDRALVRDNRVHGYPTLSLLVCAATVGPGSVDLVYGELDQPGVWSHPVLMPPRVAPPAAPVPPPT